MEKIAESPNGKHKAKLLFEGSIRFGPEYYRLQINKKNISGKIFGAEIKWSPDSRFLATQEWLTTDYEEGPITRLTLFDVPAKKLTYFDTLQKGFAQDFSFENNIVYYKESFGSSSGSPEEYGVDISKISDWQSY
jgi:hypothetical protein